MFTEVYPKDSNLIVFNASNFLLPYLLQFFFSFIYPTYPSSFSIMLLNRDIEKVLNKIMKSQKTNKQKNNPQKHVKYLQGQDEKRCKGGLSSHP